MRYAPSVGNQEEDGLFQGLQSDQLEGALEALLFVTDEPVNAIVMADMLEIEPAQAEEALGRLRDRLASEGSGIVLREVAGGWRLFTHPAYHELVESTSSLGIRASFRRQRWRLCPSSRTPSLSLARAFPPFAA